MQFPYKSTLKTVTILIFPLAYKWGPVRDDHKCGPNHQADCDPAGIYPCCTVASGWCGNSDGHCKCQQCFDFRGMSD